jgi:hypothetical protein
VVLTQFHRDHIGWTTRRGIVIFTRATYRCHERGWAYFVGPDPKITRKLGPIADRLETWSDDENLFVGVDALGTPGHTPGSTVIVVSSGTERGPSVGRHAPLSGASCSNPNGRPSTTSIRPGPADPRVPGQGDRSDPGTVRRRPLSRTSIWSGADRLGASGVGRVTGSGPVVSGVDRPCRSC